MLVLQLWAQEVGLQIYADLLMVLQASQLPRPKLPVARRVARTVTVALATLATLSASRDINGITFTGFSFGTGRSRSSALQRLQRLQRAAENLGPRDEWGIACMEERAKQCQTCRMMIIEYHYNIA